jgi:hypothetical protein
METTQDTQNAEAEVGFWLVRADDGRRAEAPREESRTCDSIAALREAIADAKAAFRGIDGARVELWARAECGHHHLQVMWVWEHGDAGSWARLTTLQGVLLSALLLGPDTIAPTPPTAPSVTEVPN